MKSIVQLFGDEYKSYINLVVSLILLPIFLYYIQTQYVLLSWFGIGGIVILIVYLILIHTTYWKHYQISGVFLGGCIYFTRVIAGNTIPIGVVVIVLGVLSFLLQEALSHREYHSNELIRQIILTSATIGAFLVNSYMFGSIYVNNITSIVLIIVYILISYSLLDGLLWIYSIKERQYIVPIIVVFLTEVFIILRFLPFTHLTQASILTIITFASLIMWYEHRNITTSKVIRNIIVCCILITFILFTSP